MKKNTAQKGLSIEVITLFLLPCFLPTLALIFYFNIGDRSIPSTFIFLLFELLITLPLLFFIMTKNEGEPLSIKSIKKIVGKQKRVPIGKFILICVASLIWALLCFVLLKNVTSYIQTNLFGWVPQWFSLGDYLHNRSLYASQYPVMIWSGMLVASIAFPFAEEVYFRGYLLQKTNQFGIWSPVINTTLFALYHIWSIWMVPVRIVAIFPMIYFVWKERNLFLGVVVHFLLNFVGDVVLLYPEIFKQ